jgi:4-deoxy-L-threo-5-hexosulose-uronate ketol-isomerase
MAVHYEMRYATNPTDAKSYDTERIRNEFLVQNLFSPGDVNMVYSFYDRLVVGGAVPKAEDLILETIDPLKAEYFCERREVGIINIGGDGSVEVDGTSYELSYKEALYVGRGARKVVFKSADSNKEARFYFNSALAHKEFPHKKVTLEDAEVLKLGSSEAANERELNKMLVNTVIETCQLQMGMTVLKTGSVWNTMPPHVHSRRMEAYLYFEVPEDQAICHFMGETDETRHIWMKNEEAVISPPWSIHAAAGTSNYIFIWGMAGENMDFGDMDKSEAIDLK